MFTFARLNRLPPYVFATVNEIKMEARRSGKDIIDLEMGNPDLKTPQNMVDYAKEHGIMVIHDFAYADLVFDDYKAPSFLQAEGAKDVGKNYVIL